MAPNTTNNTEASQTLVPWDQYHPKTRDFLNRAIVHQSTRRRGKASALPPKQPGPFYIPAVTLSATYVYGVFTLKGITTE